MNQKITNNQINRLLNKGFTKVFLSTELGISRPTFDTRLQGKSNWKLLEQKRIKELSK